MRLNNMRPHIVGYMRKDVIQIVDETAYGMHLRMLSKIG